MFKFDETITNEDLGVVLAVGGIFQGVGALLGNILTIVYWATQVTESQNCDPTQIPHFGDQFWGISQEYPRKQLLERILEKFLRNPFKKITTVGESGEFPHFHYLGWVDKGGIRFYKRIRAGNFWMVDIGIKAWSTLFLILEIK